MGLIHLPCGCWVQPPEGGQTTGRWKLQCRGHASAPEARTLLLKIHSLAHTPKTIVTLDPTPGGILDQITKLCRHLITG